jgi:hypothetical protein
MTTDQELDNAMRGVFSGNFLDATDILKVAGGHVRLTIKDIVPPNTERDSANKVIDKAIIEFEKAKKRLILNTTNAKVIKIMHGDKVSGWRGKEITLGVRYLKAAFGQKNVPVIRVIPPDDMPTTFGMRKNMGREQPYRPEEL